MPSIPSLAEDAWQSLGGRRIRIWTKPGADTFQLVSFRGREGLSKLYKFDLNLRCDSNTSVRFDDLVGQNVCVEIELPNPSWESLAASGTLPELASRRFCGIVSSITRGRTDDLYHHFRAAMVPRYWLSTLGTNFRAFHNSNSQEIASQILPSLPIRWELANPIPNRNYCVQYGESDYAFISRLFEEDGLFFYFEHNYEGQAKDAVDRCERMVVTDTVERLGPLQPQEAFEFDSVGGGNRSAMRIRKWSVHQKMTASGVDAWDRHFQLPNDPVRSSDSVRANVEISGETISLQPSDSTNVDIHYPALFASRFDDVSATGSRQVQDLAQIYAEAERDARLRSERLACKAVRVTGTSDVALLTPGFLFKQRIGLRTSEPYYVIDVFHDAELSNSPRSGSDVPPLRYRNRFSCLPKTVAYRPARKHHRPRIDGLVPATVVNDPAVTGDQVCVDRYGRVKVQFPWQQEGIPTPSCWIRVSQLWAGNRWGSFFWPRVGHEVLIAFEHGDPDRPVVVGSVYNSTNMPPLNLPANKLSGGIHSCTHHGNPLQNYSAVVFHDQPEKEFLQLHSETHESVTSETASLHHSAGPTASLYGHSGFFDLLTGSSGTGGGDAPADSDSSPADSDNPSSEDDDDNAEPSASESEGEGEGAEKDEPPEDMKGYTRFGYKGAGGDVLYWLQLLGMIPSPGSYEVQTGQKIGKKLGPTWETQFAAKNEYICDLQYLLQTAAENALGGGGGSSILEDQSIGNIIKYMIGPSAIAGEGKFIVGMETKLLYGPELGVRHGKLIDAHYPTYSSAPSGNNGELTLVGQKLSFPLLVVITLVELATAISVKILLCHGSEKEEPGSYKSPLDILEMVTASILPIMWGILVTAEKDAAVVQMGFNESEQTAELAEKATELSLTRLTPGFATAASVASLKQELDQIVSEVDTIEDILLAAE